ncbi:MAG: cupin domain-containing protein [Salinigranum sp.]
MSYTKANYGDVDPVGGGLHFLRDALDCENLGLSVLECEAGWTGMEHEHDEDDQEEVYLLVDGEATVEVDGKSVALEPGDALRVSPGASRQIHGGDEESLFVIAGAP